MRLRVSEEGVVAAEAVSFEEILEKALELRRHRCIFLIRRLGGNVVI